MRVSIRAQLFAIVATAIVAFLLLLVTDITLSARVHRESTRIEAVYVPKVELGPSLGRHFEDLSRGFQDAVAAADRDMLVQNAQRRDALVAELLSARDVFGAAKVDAVRKAVDEYWETADAVSRQILDGETGEAFVDRITAMQEKQRAASELLDDATRFDRRQLSSAFAAAERARATAHRIRIAVITVCLVLVASLSSWLVGNLVRSVRTLTEGFERFGKGQLDAPIEIGTGDELAIVAGHANRMAGNLRRTVGDLEAFNYSVSHDLRAPLRPLDGFSQALIEDYGDKLEPKAVHYLERIRAAAQRMSQLIDDLLQLSRLGRAELVFRPFDLVPIAESVIDELRRGDPDRKVEFVSMPEAKVEGDPRLMRIVLENLLRNAWKFSRGNAEARIELGTREERGDAVFFVRDNGAGFDPQHAHRLFQPFQRLHTSREYEGTGIGLAIVQQIVRRHDGRAWAESKPGEGATFFFTLREGKAKTS